MSRITIATIVEGQGEVAALPVLIRRIAAEVAPATYVDLPRPHRVKRGTLLATLGMERAVEAVAERDARVLVLLDADDDCPAALATELRARAYAARPDRISSVVVAKREFEAWFLAAAPSLRGCRGLAPNLTVPGDAEGPRDCKGWLSQRRTDGRGYRPAADQAALTAVFDMVLARKNASSFDKLWRDVERLLRVGTR
jgi:Domain of unknown function (DUF4276)